MYNSIFLDNIEDFQTINTETIVEKMMKIGIISSFLIITFVLLLIPSSNFVFAENTIPEWVTIQQQWLAEGLITEEENINGLEFLLKTGVIKIVGELESIDEFQARTDSFEDIRAQSYVVRFSNGDFKSPLEITTFAKFVAGEKQPLLPKSFSDIGISSYFSLESNPSKDKLEFYELIAKTYNPGRHPQLFDVEIDFLSGNGISIITVSYAKCKVTEYLPFIQEFVLFYPFSGMFEEEVRDRTVFKCTGTKVNVSQSDTVKDVETTVPANDDRVASYVVHFSGPDIEGLYSIGTFFNFSPSVNFFTTPYDIISRERSNPVDSKPRFVLESLPSIDKKELYEFFSLYINPGRVPQLFDVSVDLILGDGIILQRWNYVNCDLVEYKLKVEESLLRYPVTKQLTPEIRDKSEFSCNGFNLETGLDLPQAPIRDPNTIQGIFISSETPSEKDRAMSFIVSMFGGELTTIHTGESLQKFETIRVDRAATPASHAKQSEIGFLVESLPTHDKKGLYEYFARYVNPGKSPEPYDVTIDTVLGSGEIIHRLHYTKCETVDFQWFLQDATWIYQFSNKQQEEIRERYIIYCTGLRFIP